MTKRAQPKHTMIVLGGGGFSDNPGDLRLNRWLVRQCPRERPKVCFLPTASGDSDEYISRFLETYAKLDCKPSVLRLFRREVSDPSEFLCDQDLIFIGGGNTLSLLAVFRAHGVDRALDRAKAKGVILSGVSAGALCLFEDGITDSFGSGYRPLGDGLGYLRGSFCSHYQDEPERAQAYESAIASAKLPAGIALCNWAALKYTDGKLTQAVTTRAGAQAAYIARKGKRITREPITLSPLDEPVGNSRAEAEPAISIEEADSTRALIPKRDKATTTVVYTDGACSGNPGPGGWAWAVVGGDFSSGAERHTTNQRMEITAAFEAVKSLSGPILVMSDSTYVVNCFRQAWWKNWLKKGWRNSQNQPVANRDLWEPFIELVNRRNDIRFEWVKGHSQDRMNALVDQLAVEAAQRGSGRKGSLEDVHL